MPSQKNEVIWRPPSVCFLGDIKNTMNHHVDHLHIAYEFIEFETK